MGPNPGSQEMSFYPFLQGNGRDYRDKLAGCVLTQEPVQTPDAGGWHVWWMVAVSAPSNDVRILPLIITPPYTNQKEAEIRRQGC